MRLTRSTGRTIGRVNEFVAAGLSIFVPVAAIHAEGSGMTDKPTDLDAHRGMAAQLETEQRRTRKDVELEQAKIRDERDRLEHYLSAKPATNWVEAAEKARYLLELFDHTADGMDPRRRFLIHAVLADFDRLLDASPTGNDNDEGRRG